MENPSENPPYVHTNPKPGVLFHQASKSPLVGFKTRRSNSTGKTFKSALQKGESKKNLVRNTEVTVYPTKYRTDSPDEDKERKEKVSETKGASSGGLYKTNLAAPCLNSALRIVKEMKQVSKTKPSKKQQAKLLDEGKVLQQVNFLYEEHLYRDLVALNVSDSGVAEAGSSRPTCKFRAREKDKEPQLSQFFTPSFSEEFRVRREPLHRQDNYLHSSEGFSIYQRMRSWESMN